MAGLLEDGIKFFNTGHFFEAHELWEDLWRDEEGELRLFYQGLIQAAVGLHHLSRRNFTGARAQLLKSVTKLDSFPPRVAGIEVEMLRQTLRKVLDCMDPEGLPRLRIVLESEGTF